MLAMLLAAGCRGPKPAQVSQWDACLIGASRLEWEQSERERLLRVATGRGQVLYVHAAWTVAPPFALEHEEAELLVELPASMKQGERVTLFVNGAHRGQYVEGNIGVGYLSDEVVGYVTADEIDGGSALLRLELVVRHPRVDLEHRGPIEVIGPVRAVRAQSLRQCF
jgi:hypothetical protein